MIEIEIIREYKCCWRVGQRRAVSDEFAYVLIEGGYARRVEHEIDTEPKVLISVIPEKMTTKIGNKFTDIGKKILMEKGDNQ